MNDAQIVGDAKRAQPNLIMALMLLAMPLTGCAVSRNTELAWQALHLLDTAQTVTIAQSPRCLREADPFASAVYGTEHPSVKRVLVTNAIGALLHWQVGAWLDQHGPAWLHISFGGLSLASTGAGVANNLVRGVKPFGGDLCGPVDTRDLYHPNGQ